MTSRLCIYDLGAGAGAGAVREVLRTERLIEAPNWSPDGARLVVNGDGLIFSVDLENPGLERINTGPCTACNNDHGITPDGQGLIISDNGGGGSRIHMLPLQGSDNTRLLTAEAPSYWHGISPDGAEIAYVAKRGEDARFDLFTMDIKSGAERRITAGEGHYDGPDYTPDGRWIWVNSDRGGAMDLWRMRPDGAQAEQMTDDAWVNWFPHPSPDGKWVVYVAFPTGTEGHPRGREVELRLMPAEVGAPRVLHALFGGQGTINVPSWHPGSGQFAFVEYERP